jgi:hypothetical protein
MPVVTGFKRAGVGTNDILKCKFLSKNAHRASSRNPMTNPNTAESMVKARTVPTVFIGDIVCQCGCGEDVGVLWLPSVLCGVIGVATEFMVRWSVTTCWLPSALCDVIGVATEFMVRWSVTTCWLLLVLCDVIDVVTEFMVRWSVTTCWLPSVIGRELE